MLMFSCGNYSEKTGINPGNIEITDASGKKILIPDSSKFIVTLSQTEIFRILNAEDRIEGVNRWVAGLNYEESPVLRKLPVIGGFSPGDVNYEMIYKISNDSPENDVIITYNQPWAEKVDEKIDGSGRIKVVKFNLFGSEQPEYEIRMMAKMLNREKECEKYLFWYDSLFSFVESRIKDIPQNQRMTVYWDASAKGHYDSAGKNSSINFIIAKAGGISITASLPSSSVNVSPEYIIKQDPDIIISHAANARHLTNIQLGYGIHNLDTIAFKNALKELISTPGINHTKAAINGKVYYIADDLMSGASRAAGAVLLAKCFYPDKFTDIDIDKLLKYYYESFMRLSYKGLYIYP